MAMFSGGGGQLLLTATETDRNLGSRVTEQPFKGWCLSCTPQRRESGAKSQEECLRERKGKSNALGCEHPSSASKGSAPFGGKATTKPNRNPPGTESQDAVTKDTICAETESHSWSFRFFSLNRHHYLESHWGIWHKTTGKIWFSKLLIWLKPNCIWYFYWLKQNSFLLAVLNWPNLGPWRSRYNLNSATNMPDTPGLSHFPSFALWF